MNPALYGRYPAAEPHTDRAADRFLRWHARQQRMGRRSGRDQGLRGRHGQADHARVRRPVPARTSTALRPGEPASYYKGGPQAYPGFAPKDSGVNTRESWAGYIDVALDPVEALHLDFAGRYEHYSDFGDVWTGKATARYDFSSAFALRGTVSNGFRAPHLGRAVLLVGQRRSRHDLRPVPAQLGSLRAARFSAICSLRKSTNFSFGVGRPSRTRSADHDRRVPDQADPAHRAFSGDLRVSTAALPGMAALSRRRSLMRWSRAASIPPTPRPMPASTSSPTVRDSRTRGVEATIDYATDFGDSG